MKSRVVVHPSALCEMAMLLLRCNPVPSLPRQSEYAVSSLPFFPIPLTSESSSGSLRYPCRLHTRPPHDLQQVNFMQCPKCRSEVPEGHFYCPNCRTLTYDYRPERPKRGPLERAGARLLDLALAVAIIGVLIFTARQINWREFIANVRGQSPPTAPRAAATDSAAAKPSATARRTREGHATQTTTPPAARKIEELPAVQVQPDIRLAPPSTPLSPQATPPSKPASNRAPDSDSH